MSPSQTRYGARTGAASGGTSALSQVRGLITIAITRPRESAMSGRGRSKCSVQCVSCNVIVVCGVLCGGRPASSSCLPCPLLALSPGCLVAVPGGTSDLPPPFSRQPLDSGQVI